MSIAVNVAGVRDQIAAACRQVGRDPSAVRLIAVTKTQGPEVLPELIAAGVSDFGENRVEHLAEMTALAPAGARFHYIGRIQGRQLAKAAASCVAIHALCETDHISRLARAAEALGKRQAVYIQVNTAGETQKAGLAPADLPTFLDRCRAHAHLEILGLMCMAPEFGPGVDETVVRRAFAELRRLAETHSLVRLSMGMSQDFALAIAEGATEVRVGTRLFV